MTTNQDNRAIFRVAWAVMVLGLVSLTAALAWRFHAVRGMEKQAVEGKAAPAAAAVQPVERSSVASVPLPLPRRAPREPMVESQILEKDPGLIDRQAKWMREQAEASERAEFGPRSLAPTEAGIREMEQKQLVLQ